MPLSLFPQRLINRITGWVTDNRKYTEILILISDSEFISNMIIKTISKLTTTAVFNTNIFTEKPAYNENFVSRMAHNHLSPIFKNHKLIIFNNFSRENRNQIDYLRSFFNNKIIVTTQYIKNFRDDEDYFIIELPKLKTYYLQQLKS